MAYHSSVLVLSSLLLSLISLPSSALTMAANNHDKRRKVSNMKFYTSKTCPFAARAAIALEEVGAPYEKVLIDLQNKPPEFLEVYSRANPLPNARAKVPVLEVALPAGDDGQDNTLTLTESKIVADYLGEAFPGVGLAPTDAYDRVVLRLFTELCGSASFSYYFSIVKAAKNDPAKFEASVSSLTQGMINANAFLEAKAVAGGPFLFGKRFTLAECEAAPFVQRACFILPNFTGKDHGCEFVDPMKICDDHKLDRLKEWMTATLARPSVEAARVPDEDMKASVSGILARL